MLLEASDSSNCSTVSSAYCSVTALPAEWEIDSEEAVFGMMLTMIVFIFVQCMARKALKLVADGTPFHI